MKMFQIVRNLIKFLQIDIQIKKHFLENLV